MDKQAIYALLESEGIWHEITEHEAVYNMDELSHVDLPCPEADAKNLFIRDDKKRNYYLITVKGSKRVDLKEFRKQHGTRALRFASEDDLLAIMGLTTGAVSPFGMLNDQDLTVKFFLDAEFLDDPGLIGIHPNDNTATVLMKTQDLVGIIERHGNAVEIAAF